MTAFDVWQFLTENKLTIFVWVLKQNIQPYNLPSMEINSTPLLFLRHFSILPHFLHYSRIFFALALPYHPTPKMHRWECQTRTPSFNPYKPSSLRLGGALAALPRPCSRMPSVSSWPSHEDILSQGSGGQLFFILSSSAPLPHFIPLTGNCHPRNVVRGSFVSCQRVLADRCCHLHLPSICPMGSLRRPKLSPLEVFRSCPVWQKLYHDIFSLGEVCFFFVSERSHFLCFFWICHMQEWFTVPGFSQGTIDSGSVLFRSKITDFTFV